MMLFRWIAAAALSLLASSAFGQGAQFPAGTVWGNSTATQRPGKAETVTAILDRAFGSTRGSLLIRGASGWVIVAPGTSGRPFVSAGAGADPLYQVLGLVGGGTGLDMTATGGTGRFLKQNTLGGAITVTQPAFTDISGQATVAQLPQGIANSIFINPTGSTANMQNVAVPACANDGAHALVYVNASGLACATLATGGTVTNVATAGLATGGPITTTGTVTVTAATKTDQETATSSTTVVTPLRQQSHPSAVKAWGNFAAATGAVNAGYNMNAATHTATTGLYTINFTTAFASTAYSCVASVESTGAGGTAFFSLINAATKTVSSISLSTITFAGGNADPTASLDVVCFGTQ